MKRVPILQNGYRKYRSKKCTELTYNTCAFDVPFQIFATSFIDYEFMQTRYHESEEADFCSMIIAAFESKQKDVLKDLYARRNNILEKLHGDRKITTANGLTQMDCNSNIFYVLERVLPQSFRSYIRTKRCRSCKNKLESHRVCVDINLETFANPNVSIRDLEIHIKQELLSEEEISKCTKCGGKYQIETVLSEVIMIDIQLQPKGIDGPHPRKMFSINEAPEELRVCGITFRILALAEFTKDSDDINDIGHYIAHIRRFNNQWEEYDDTKKTIHSPKCKEMKEIHTLFYIKKSKN